MRAFSITLTCLFVCLVGRLPAEVGLTTVPVREQVRLTIYNAVDLTLAQESRTLVLKEGINRIQYQWAGTLIDATSIELKPLAHQDQIEIVDLIYPPGAPATLQWNVESKIEGPVPFEISYFTSGLSWSADYVLRASPDEASGEVEGTVAVVNHSGEDYPAAEVRLVLGTINLVEHIRDLATRQEADRRRELKREDLVRYKSAFASESPPGTALVAEVSVEETKRPEVVSQRLADYHIFTIGGVQAVADGATTRFLAITTAEPMALENLYRVNLLEDQATKLYRFLNDADHHLPKDGPLPNGVWNVFRVTDAKEKTLSFLGRCGVAYIPPGQKVELPLGVDPAIAVKQRHLDVRQTDFHYDRHGRVDGWIDHRQFSLRLVNTKAIPVSLEYLVQTGGGDWEIAALEGERRSVDLYRHQTTVTMGAVYAPPPFTLSTRQSVLANRPDDDKPEIRLPPPLVLPLISTTP